MAVNSQLKLKVFAKDKYRCIECGSAENLTIDHIMPLSKGGTDEIHNLQTMCKDCNWRKGSSQITWLQRIFRFVTHDELHRVREDMLGSMVSKDGLQWGKSKGMITNEVNNVRSRIGDIEIHAKEYIDKLMKSNPLTEVGIKNSVDAYNVRSKERDDKLLKIIYLQADELEEQDKRIGDLEAKVAWLIKHTPD